MRRPRLLPCAAAIVVVTSACGGSSTPAAAPAQPLPSQSSSGTASPATSATLTASPAPQPTAAASPTAAGKATPARTASAAPKPSPKPTPQASPKPSPKSSPLPPPGPTHGLDMTAGYRFSPMTLTIGLGDAVQAHNVDSMAHTFTGPSWDSGNVTPGQSSRVFRFNTAGTFHFFCTPHQGLGMTGTLTVQ